eukprot:5160653-Alexandrium_andersonii.AAC.1
MRKLEPGKEPRNDPLHAPASDSAGSMAWHYRFQPLGDLPSATSGPGTDDHRSYGDGPEA